MTLERLASISAAKCGDDAKRSTLQTPACALANPHSAYKISALSFDRGVESLFGKFYCSPRDGDEQVEDHCHSTV